MDPFSHALLGAASAQSVSRLQRPLAVLAGVAGALLPDADVFITSEADPLLVLEFHRQFTHSFAAAPFGALLVAAVFWLAARRRVPFGALYWPALAGYSSALLLDVCTSYGTQLLWPFTDRRFSASIVAVVDPVVTVTLLGAVVLAWRQGRARPARIGIALIALYLAFGWIQRERAEALIQSAAAKRGHRIEEHEVKPTLGNLMLWRSVYLSGSDYVVDAVRGGIFSEPRLYPGASVRRVRPDDLVPPLTPDSVQARDLQRFARASEGYLVRHPSIPSVVGDIRYAMLPDSVRPLWGIAIEPERPNEHVTFRTYREFDAADRQRFVAMLLGRPLAGE